MPPEQGRRGVAGQEVEAEPRWLMLMVYGSRHVVYRGRNLIARVEKWQLDDRGFETYWPLERDSLD